VSGQLGPSPGRVEVVSVHRRVLSLRLESGGLVTVGAPEVPLAPGGLTIDLDVGIALADLGLAAGQPGGIDRGRLSIPAARLRILLEGAVPWEPRPALPSLSAAQLGRRARDAGVVAIAEGGASSLVPLLWAAGAAAPSAVTARAARAMRDLRRAAVAGDGAGVETAARGLAGLGPGLTPSGDDCLAGFAAAWALESPSLGLCPAGVEGVLDGLRRGGAPGASEIGRAWLAHATRGEVAEPMGQFFRVLVGGADARLAGAVRAVLALGATSGGDWMTGALLGTEALLERRARAWS
jgi:hypothetical protein